ncbi:hypothetical protein RFI_03895 [Reticulomyxa filosa]|uniref:Uncharacterized protein n=1 Tax=Reticulomyxa filosa TaxID=46433 RepID=X6P6G6_RETFI|nr:hypothetical protein RFI_03895 [Reticulomyxa filosa]|eukprot:ETO33212.1 hypothetical protein RFI_03895 [Reticulomyxa filosa]
MLFFFFFCKLDGIKKIAWVDESITKLENALMKIDIKEYLQQRQFIVQFGNEIQEFTKNQENLNKEFESCFILFFFFGKIGSYLQMFLIVGTDITTQNASMGEEMVEFKKNQLLSSFVQFY